ncbi:hypothetical protein SCUCBS95973_001514 [Sporothrix curviconia]|uniref:EamA domain-containing protein n=1 Tax=Sporothrix curviconia TaxID=1260050 RepID=A0ABP0AZT7_9PEZI
MARPTDRRSGTPLLHGHNSNISARSSRSPSRPDIDRGRAGYRTPRRLSDSSGYNEVASSQPILSSSSSPPPPPRPGMARQSSFRSRSPASNARHAARKRYAYASIFLVLSLVSFTVQTELAAWVQHAGWNKAYCMLYLTHGSWSLLWPVQLLILRVQKRAEPWATFWRRHVWLVRTTAQMVETRELQVDGPGHHHVHHHGHHHQPSSPLADNIVYMARVTAFVTVSLTVAGLSWYVAVSMTSPSDLTAIYNCSAFFAYAFSVPLLKERLRLDKSLAVLVAVAGVLVVAYGDAGAPEKEGGGDDNNGTNTGAPAENRLLGNLIIGAGSVLYGLYEVLYKRFACPPDGCSPGRGMIFANTFGSCIGVFTLTVLWLPLPVLHILGVETFALPTGRVAWYLFLSVVMNATFAGSFLVLISLTSPVLSSVASLLTIFIVAVSDWWLTGVPPSAAALLGGSMIVVAFALLSWSTYKEMTEEEQKREVDIAGSDSEDD